MARGTRLLAAAIALGCMALPVWGAVFSDLSAGSTTARLAALLARRGVLNGASETEFATTSTLDRYELAESLNALLDPGDSPFNVIAWSDIPPGHPAMNAVSRVTSLNLMGGEHGRFEGLRRVTRLECVASLARLLDYRAVSPPPRRHGLVMSFSDVSAGSDAARLLDRAGNFWQILDGPARSRFRPFERITRLEALDMLARATMLVDPSLEAPIKEAIAAGDKPLSASPSPPQPTPPYPRPTMLPRWPGATPSPSTPTPETPAPTPVVVATPPSSPTPSPEPTPRHPFWVTSATESPSPPSPEPSPVPSPSAPPNSGAPAGELLANKGRFGLGMVLYFRDGVPADTTLVSSDPTDKSDLQAVAPGYLNLDAGGTLWAGPWGGALGLTTVFPIQTSLPGGAQLADVTLHVEGLYKLPARGETWQAAGGLGVLERYLNGAGSGYLTTSKNEIGFGPAGLLAFQPLPVLTVTTGLQIYPLEFQSYSLGTRDLSAMRFGGGWQIAGDYTLLKVGDAVLLVRVAYLGSLSSLFDGSGLQTVHTLTLGAGGRF